MKTFLLIFVVVLFYDCSPKLKSGREENFIFINGKESVKLEILTGNKFIQSGVATNIKVITENIKVENLAFGGPGLRFVKNEYKFENEMTLEVNFNKENFDSGIYTLWVSYKSDGKSVSHTFLIPVK